MTSSKAPLVKGIDLTSGQTKTKLEWPIPVLKENEHYYMENGFMVFTHAYHSARGRCCGNACRHCPFDHANVRST
ncbi:MAG: hypothetical protein ACI8XV_000582 [Arenicella sp.]|jgi:hypothetical protein